MRQHVVNMRLDGPRARKGLAKAGDAGIGLDMHPEYIGEFLEPEGADGGDLHGFLSLGSGTLPSVPKVAENLGDVRGEGGAGMGDVTKCLGEPLRVARAGAASAPELCPRF